MHDADAEWNEIKRGLHEDAQSSRRFLTVAIPLACGYILAAQIWMQSNDPFWLLLSVIALASLIGYFAAFVIRGFAGKRCGQSDEGFVNRHRWIRMLEKMVDNDAVFMGVTIGVPILELMVLNMAGRVTQGSIMRWVQAAVCVLYLAYIAVFLFVQGHRAVMLMLKAKELELIRANERMAVMRRDAAIASKTHDSVTGVLSFIAFVAQNHMTQAASDDGTGDANVHDSESCVGDWQAVNKAALDALDDVHAVIRLLDVPMGGDGAENEVKPNETQTSSPGNNNDSLAKLISQVCASGDDRLQRLGFQGAAVVQLDSDLCGGGGCLDEASAIADLIGELYTNIGKYADRSSPYYLTVTSEDSALVIVQSNGISLCANDGAAEHARRPSGLQQGLALHRKQIESAGGVMNSSVEDNEWTLYIRIPC